MKKNEKKFKKETFLKKIHDEVSLFQDSSRFLYSFRS